MFSIQPNRTILLSFPYDRVIDGRYLSKEVVEKAICDIKYPIPITNGQPGLGSKVIGFAINPENTIIKYNETIKFITVRLDGCFFNERYTAEIDNLHIADNTIQSMEIRSIYLEK